MVKKKQTIVVNQEELSTTVIGEINEKHGNLVFLLFVFVFLILAIFGSPYVSQYIEENGIKIPFINNSNTPINNDEVVELVVSSKETYTDNMSLADELLEISDINIKNGYLSYNVKNITEEKINLKNYNYFLIFYSENKPVGYWMLKKVSIDSGATKQYKYKKSLKSIDAVELTELSTSEYPDVVIEENENNEGIITCIYSDETITYQSTNDVINKLSIKAIIDFDDEKNSKKYNDYISKYENQEGFNSSLGMEDDKILYEINVDLSKIDMTEYGYYKNGTSIKVISFELNAQGYTCK